MDFLVEVQVVLKIIKKTNRKILKIKNKMKIQALRTRNELEIREDIKTANYLIKRRPFIAVIHKTGN